MKKLLKPEIEFVKFENADVITTSGIYIFGDDAYASEAEYIEAEENANYGNGDNPLWNGN